MTQTTTSRLIQYLPAVYRDDQFLESFLAAFEQALAPIEAVLAEIDHYDTPYLTPTRASEEDQKASLRWLATWLAFVLDETWSLDRKRELLQRAVTLYRTRGTLGQPDPPTGLKGYLKIYTGLEPRIDECRWPGGMQIGVASRIGHFGQAGYHGEVTRYTRHAPPVYYDYYVVTDTAGRTTYYYRADRVESVDIEWDVSGTQMTRVTVTDIDGRLHLYEHASVTRRDHMIDDQYRLTVPGPGASEQTLDYSGDTVLIGRVDAPYCFIVEVFVSAQGGDAINQDMIEKVRAIIEAEKPAHTLYYLKLTAKS